MQISSLAKYVLDNDQVGALRRYLREDPIDETTALMDDILEVGIGGHFLGRKSTRAHSRSEVWRPRAFRKGTFEEFAGRPLAAEAAERAREIIATHEVPPLPEDVERHIDSVIATVAAQAARA